MPTKTPKALLVGENHHASSRLAKYLQKRGFHCEFASSCQEVVSLVGVRDFHLVLSPIRLRNSSLYFLMDFLEGSEVTLFYFQTVEKGCWWLPAMRRGKRCLGSSALRPSDFVSALDEAIGEVRRGSVDAEKACDEEVAFAHKRCVGLVGHAANTGIDVLEYEPFCDGQHCRPARELATSGDFLCDF